MEARLAQYEKEADVLGFDFDPGFPDGESAMGGFTRPRVTRPSVAKTSSMIGSSKRFVLEE